MARMTSSRRISVAVLAFLAGPVNSVSAADLLWEVENPFRFYKSKKSFKIHEDAFNAVRGPGGVIPDDIIQRMERCLNDPDRSDASTVCGGLSRGLSGEQRRQGWASRTLDDVCYRRMSLRRG